MQDDECKFVGPTFYPPITETKNRITAMTKNPIAKFRTSQGMAFLLAVSVLWLLKPPPAGPEVHKVGVTLCTN